MLDLQALLFCVDAVTIAATSVAFPGSCSSEERHNGQPGSTAAETPVLQVV